jgi:anti-anti-sigma factor
MIDQPGPQLFVNFTVDGGGVIVARLVGPSFGAHEAPIISSEVQERMAAAADLRHVVLDLSEITFMNSRALGVCVEIHNAARAVKAKAVLYAIRPELRDVLKLTKMDKLFKIIDDEKGLGKLLK